MRVFRWVIIFILTIWGIVLIQRSYPWVLLKLTSLPVELKDAVGKQTGMIVFLYGHISQSCPSGKTLSSLSKNQVILYVVPEDYQPMPPLPWKPGTVVKKLRINFIP